MEDASRPVSRGVPGLDLDPGGADAELGLGAAEDGGAGHANGVARVVYFGRRGGMKAAGVPDVANSYLAKLFSLQRKHTRATTRKTVVQVRTTRCGL